MIAAFLVLAGAVGAGGAGLGAGGAGLGAGTGLGGTAAASTAQAPRPAKLCGSWRAPVELGKLDTALLPESSGLAVSRRFADRVYHVNDSGDEGAFLVSARDGTRMRRVRIKGFKPVDTEDLGLGGCGEGRSCLFVADIGDNRVERPSVRVIAIEEKESFGDAVTPLREIELRYPDGPHNAEGFAVHPDGNWYVVTKEQGKKARHGTKRADAGPGAERPDAPPARVYRVNGERALSGGATLEHVGTLELSRILSGVMGDFGQLVTGFDLSPDGSRALLLTYFKAIELDFAALFKPVAAWTEGRDYRLIGTQLLPQQEAIAYLPDGRDFVYSSEERKGFGKPPLVLSECGEN